MCGISGFIDFKLNSSEEILKLMTEQLFHRGPDAGGYEILHNKNYTIGLGHRRLSIIDLTETGKQPMEYKGVWITFNGEVYNYNEIKLELIDLGHTFKGNSDTEVVLHAYLQWGINSVSKFIGMFAYVLFDTNNKIIYCVRDRAGIKPFFYYWNEGLFLFASELKSFQKHPQFKKELDLDSVAAFMQYGNVPTPHCIFKNCSKLAPGHYLEFDISESKLKAHKYWDVYEAYNKPKLKLDFEEGKSETEKLLK
jgi:asparagine synthase (glutamine-hydrolysing)